MTLMGYAYLRAKCFLLIRVSSRLNASSTLLPFQLIAYLQKLAGDDPETKLEFPWRSAVDPKSGLTYYYNSVTREVRWDAPIPKKVLPEDRAKKDLITGIYAVNLKILKPFRLPNCITGRLESDEDMKYVAKKASIICVCPSFWKFHFFSMLVRTTISVTYVSCHYL